jgi:hypothetical protein
MTPAPNDAPPVSPDSDEPFFHEPSGTIRFWVLVDGRLLGASVAPLSLHYRFRPTAQNEDAMETFRLNLPDIEQAVRHRLADGAREPVMLREHDLRVRSAQGPA